MEPRLASACHGGRLLPRGNHEAVTPRREWLKKLVEAGAARPEPGLGIGPVGAVRARPIPGSWGEERIGYSPRPLGTVHGLAARGRG